MKNNYWADRFIEEEKRLNNLASDEVRKQQLQYEKSLSKINRDIEVWYGRIAKNNEVSLVEAKRLLNKKELKEFRWTLEEYIKYGRENGITRDWSKQLENASARVHIERLEALKLQVRGQIEKLYSGRESEFENYLKNVYEDQYTRTAFQIAKGTRIGSNLYKLNDKLVESVIKKPWSPDGKNFSERIWEDKNKLINILHTELTQGFIRGDSLDKMIKSITTKMNVSKSNVERLIYTESAAYSSKARQKSFIDLDVEKYEIVATLDRRTSKICQGLDGKVFEMKDYDIGTTAPPFHPRCRSTTVPYFNDMESERAMKGNNVLDKNGKVIGYAKTEYVSADMKYDEWAEKYLKNEIRVSVNKVDSFGERIHYRYLGKFQNSGYNSIESLLETYEKKIYKNSYESAMIVTENGEIYIVKGDDGSVPLHKIYDINFENASMTHNHPVGLHEWGFSGGDFDNFRNYNFKYMRAIDEKYVHELDSEIYDVGKYLEEIEKYIKNPNELSKLNDEERNKVMQIFLTSEKKLRYRRVKHGY